MLEPKIGKIAERAGYSGRIVLTSVPNSSKPSDASGAAPKPATVHPAT